MLHPTPEGYTALTPGKATQRNKDAVYPIKLWEPVLGLKILCLSDIHNIGCTGCVGDRRLSSGAKARVVGHFDGDRLCHELPACSGSANLGVPSVTFVLEEELADYTAARLSTPEQANDIMAALGGRVIP